jgi:hypothetical protein
MQSKRLALQFEEKDGSEVPWRIMSRSLDVIPDLMLNRLYELITLRIIDLPIQSSGALTACLVEVIMRSPSEDLQKSAFPMLLAIRIKTKNKNIYDSESFVQAVDRYIANKDQPSLVDLSNFLADWSKDIITVPGVERRFEVALAIKEFYKHATDEIKQEVLPIIFSLTNDPNMSYWLNIGISGKALWPKAHFV